MEGTSVRQWVGFAAMSIVLIGGAVATIAWVLMTFVMRACGC